MQRPKRTDATCPGTAAVSPIVLLGVAALLLTLVPAHAEKGDKDKPINIQSDKLYIDDVKKESIFEGNVVLTQGTLTLMANRAVVRQDQKGFNYGVAYGKPAYFRQKREGYDEYIEGNAERLEYDGKADRVQLFTNAQIRKGQDEVRGDYISYDATTEYYQVTGGGKLAATPTNPSGRVQVTLQPRKTEPDTTKGTKPDASSSPADNSPGLPPKPKPSNLPR